MDTSLRSSCIPGVPCSLARCMFSAIKSMPCVMFPSLNRFSLMVLAKKLSNLSEPPSLMPVSSESTLEIPMAASGPMYVTNGRSKPC